MEAQVPGEPVSSSGSSMQPSSPQRLRKKLPSRSGPEPLTVAREGFERSLSRSQRVSPQLRTAQPCGYLAVTFGCRTIW